MGCKCGQRAEEQEVFRPQAATRAAMCRTCPWMPADKGEREPCQLTIGDVPLKQACLDPRAKCKEGRWPDANGIVEWGLVRWVGVPDPLRWWLALALGREPGVPGCGCLVKGLASRWARWIHPWASISRELRGVVVGIIAGWRQCKQDWKRC